MSGSYKTAFSNIYCSNTSFGANTQADTKRTAQTENKKCKNILSYNKNVISLKKVKQISYNYVSELITPE